MCFYLLFIFYQLAFGLSFITLNLFFSLIIINLILSCFILKDGTTLGSGGSVVDVLVELEVEEVEILLDVLKDVDVLDEVELVLILELVEVL